MGTKNLANPVIRVISVLDCFSRFEPELRAAEIQRKTGISKATLHRILTTLTNRRLLEKNQKTGMYKIGPELYTLGSLYLGTTDVLKAAEPVIKELNDLTGEAVNISIFDKGYVTLILKEEAKSVFRFAVRIGTIIPAYASSMGKALLTELTNEEIDSLYPEEKLRPLTTKTIATKTELKRELEQIRKTGVSFSDGGTYEGLFGVASVVRDASGKGIAAMSIALPIFKVNETTSDRLATLIRMGAKLISYRLGYNDAVNPVRDIQEIRSWWEQNKPSSTTSDDQLRKCSIWALKG